MRFIKGQGTGNDFVLFADPDGAVEFTEELAAGLANRRYGIGADGVIRAVRSEALEEGQTALALDPTAEWFMDYRNHDGSLAEMCGNGVRVFVDFLRAQGLIEVADGDSVVVGTRAGVCEVRRDGDQYAADLGTWKFPGGQAAVRRGCDVQIFAEGIERPLGGLSVGVGNPHVVASVSAEELEALSLRDMPQVTPAPKNGTNVEFVVLAPVSVGDTEGEITMRVWERGVGETLSCGTGACAAALAAWAWSGPAGPTRWTVNVPGGTLWVRMMDDVVELTGPAALVAEGVYYQPVPNATAALN
ncbi:MAG: diaminopimelate epimerase [Bifidobacteriaceae bacterium]|nr:diaminopimelate epimerase [Bifidobacteriaceae bacterium]